MSKVLIALTSHAELGDTGRRTGFYVPEVAHPYAVFTAAGYEVDYVSVAGGEPPRDGVKPGDEVVAAFLAEQGSRLAETPTPDQVKAADYDAVLFAGGHGTMWDFPPSTALAALAAEIYENGGVVAAVCHGPAALVNLTLSDGTHLVSGRRVSAFTNAEEAAVGLTEGRRPAPGHRPEPGLGDQRRPAHAPGTRRLGRFWTFRSDDGRLTTWSNESSAPPACPPPRSDWAAWASPRRTARPTTTSRWP
jgi:putative intracellular protease/amidase